MSGVLNRFGRERGLAMFADWSDRITAGEVPEAPPRPRGVERNLVLTMWDWAGETSYVHDEVTTDKRDPTVNGGGLVYGVSITTDKLVITDTAGHRSIELDVPLRELREMVPSMFPTAPGFEPSPYWGDEIIFDAPANPHNPMMDARGRVWLTSTVRRRENPDWCRAGSDHPSARYFPIDRSGRQISVYDPATEDWQLIDSCYGTHHLQFGEDAQDTLWFSGDPNVVGWLDTKLYDETGDEQLSQGWCPTVIDTNGDGVITRPWNEPGGEVDPGRDTRIAGFAYGVIANPVDDTAWVARTGPFPGRLVRLDRGDNPPETCIAEVYEPPSVENPSVDPAQTGHAPRGVDVDRNGVIWTALSGSGHMASFDRSRCRVAERAGRHRPALSRRAGPCIRLPDPRCRESPTPAAPTITTTTGSTSSAPWGSARTSPSPPDRDRTRCWRSCPTPGSGSSCGSPIRLVSSPAGSTAASTMPTRAGRGAGSGPTTGRT